MGNPSKPSHLGLVHLMFLDLCVGVHCLCLDEHQEGWLCERCQGSACLHLRCLPKLVKGLRLTSDAGSGSCKAQMVWVLVLVFMLAPKLVQSETKRFFMFKSCEKAY